MFIRRLLALLCSLFLVFCVAWPGAYAVEVPDPEDMGIDPWGDLGLIQETPEPTPTVPIQEPDQLAPVDLEPAGEGGSSVFSIFPGEDSYSIGSQAASPIKFYTSSDGVSFSSSLKSLSLDPNPPSFSDLSSYSMGVRLAYNSTTVTANTRYFGWSFAPGAVLRVTQSREIPADTYQTISLNGSVSALTWVYFSQDNSYSPNGIPDFCQLCVNGVGVGPKFARTNDIFTFSGSSPIDISRFAGVPISTVGFLFSFKDSNTSSPYRVFHWSSTGSNKVTQLRFQYDDSNLSLSWSKDDISSGGSGSTAEDDQQRHEETKGLLNSIIAFLQSIINGIGNIATAITQLPGKIANLIIEGIKSLFIPSEEDLGGIKEQYTQLLEERLGFVWQAGEMVISFGQSVLSAFETATDFQFEFPGVSFELPELGQVTLIEAQTVNVNNAFMDVMQPVLGTIVSFICVLAFINTAERMVIAVVSGVSYFHFLKGD